MQDGNFKFEFKRSQINKIPKPKVVEELKRVAEIYGYKRFTRHEFDKVAKACKGTTVLNLFGTWQQALEAIGKKLEKQQVDRSIISTKALFEEMERIWRLIGHRPSKNEWDISKPKYSYTTYKSRFKGWSNACLKFIEYKMGHEFSEIDNDTPLEASNEKLNKKSAPNYVLKDLRTIPLKLRLRVLERDKFRCVFCGKSPATDIGVKLHIDHIVPFSKGGKTMFDNLQTLCYECNLGKGNGEQNMVY